LLLVKTKSGTANLHKGHSPLEKMWDGLNSSNKQRSFYPISLADSQKYLLSVKLVL